MPQICRVCSHEKRVEIERMLVQGQKSKLAIARLYSISKDSVRNHWINHMADRIARCEEVQAVEAADVLGTLNTVLYKLNNALNQAEKINDRKEFRETSKVLFQGSDLLTKIQMNLQNRKFNSLSDDELQEFLYWKEHRFDELLEYPEEIQKKIDEVCLMILAMESGASINSPNTDRKYEPQSKLEAAKAPWEINQNSALNTARVQEPVHEEPITEENPQQEEPGQEAEHDMKVRPIPPEQIPCKKKLSKRDQNILRGVRFRPK